MRLLVAFFIVIYVRRDNTNKTLIQLFNEKPDNSHLHRLFFANKRVISRIQGQRFRFPEKKEILSLAIGAD